MRIADIAWDTPARIAEFERTLSRIQLPHVMIVCILLTIASVAFHQGGFAHPETEIRLPFYLADRPLINKLFDSRTLDYAGGVGGEYQGRELSYVFDYLDSQFIKSSVSSGFPHLLSLTHYVFALLIAYLMWRFSARVLNASPWVAAGMILMFWTSPAVFLGGVFFRTAKIGVALATAVLCYLILSVLSSSANSMDERLPAQKWLACFGASLASMLFDMQGIYLVGIAMTVLLIWMASYRSRMAAELMSACLASLAVVGLYRYWWAPSITFSLSHYWPDTAYLSLPWGSFLQNPLFYIVAGLSLSASTLSALLGNVPALLIGGTVAGLAACLLVLVPRLIRVELTGARERPDLARAKLYMTVAAAIIVSNILLVWLMNSLMVLRHPPLLWPDVRLTYYWLPVVVLHCMTLMFLVAWLSRNSALWRLLLPILLATVVLSNAVAIPGHQSVIEQGHMQKYMQTGPALLQALRGLNDPTRKELPAIQQDTIYQYFRNAGSGQ